MMNKIKVQQTAYHRNGVKGNGYYLVLFKDGREDRLAIVFEDRGNVAIINPHLINAGVIAFGEASYRCEDYEPELRQAIDKWENER